MPIIVGIVIIVVAGFVMQAFEAIGGWPGLIVIAAAVAGGIWFISSTTRRNAERRELEALPGRIRQREQEITEAVEAIHTAMVHAVAEKREGRAPLFWDQFEAACYHVFVIEETFELIHADAKRFDEEALKYGLMPKSLAFSIDESAIRDDLETRKGVLLGLQNEALTDPGFAVVFEQRRQGRQILERQEALHEDLADVAATSQAALRAAEAASDDARSARWEARRASGRWF